ncbi:MAG: Ig-like domain-containing protein, partial [Nanoarchaeota archaeon]
MVFLGTVTVMGALGTPRILNSLMLFFVLGVMLSSTAKAQSNILSLEQKIFIGDPLRITINDPQNISVEISFQDFRYFYNNFEQGFVEFNPTAVGNYTVNAVDKITGNLTETHQVEVVDNVVSAVVASEQPELTIEKGEYVLGETVTILLPALPNLSLVIKTSEAAYKYFELPETSVNFVPQKIGPYIVTLQKDGIQISEAGFKVIASNPETSKVFPADKQDNLHIKTSHRDLLASETPEFKFNSNSSKKKQGLDALAVAVLGQKKKVTARLIGDSGTDLSSSVESSVDEMGEVTVNIKRPKAFRPGRFTLGVTLEENGVTETFSQDFTWGVLAINPDKDKYLPGQNAFIGIAVLDNLGKTVCAASVKLSMAKPDGSTVDYSTSDGSIQTSPQCSYLGVTELPDYYLTIPVETSGNYVMNLTADISDGTRSIISNFTAKDSLDYQITRYGPTRLYPYSVYTMNLSVKAFKSFNGSITDEVPAGFSLSAENGDVISMPESQLIKWDASLSEGEKKSFIYHFDPPDIWPFLFEAGAAKIGDYSENRTWMLASDAGSVNSRATGRIFHQNSTDLQTLFSSDYNGTSYLVASNLSIPISQIFEMNVRANPNKDEQIVIFSHTATNVSAVVCNPICGNLITFTTSNSNPSTRTFDVAYEDISGKAIVTYSLNADPIPRYRIWDGSSWSPENSVRTDLCTGETRWISMTSKPRSNEISAIFDDANSDMCFQVWDGKNWIFDQMIENNSLSVTYRNFAIAYESIAGRALIAWSNSTWTGPIYNIWNGTNLTYYLNPTKAMSGLRGPTTDVATIRWIRLSSDPTSNRIIYASLDQSSDINLLEWSGTAWGARTGGADYDGSVELSTSPIIDVSYRGTTGIGTVFYGNLNNNFIHYGTCTNQANCAAGTWSASETQCPSASDAGSNLAFVEVANSLRSNELMVVIRGQSAPANALAEKFDGSTCSATNFGSGTATHAAGRTAAFTYDDYPDMTPAYYLQALKQLWNFTAGNESSNFSLSNKKPVYQADPAKLRITTQIGQWSAPNCHYLWPRFNQTLFATGNATTRLYLTSNISSAFQVNVSLAEVLGINGTIRFENNSITTTTVGITAIPKLHNFTDNELYSHAFLENSTIRLCYSFNTSAKGSINITFDNASLNSSLDFGSQFTDTFPPYWSGNATNASDLHPRFNGIIQLNVTLLDNFNLSRYIFSTNQSGTWQNQTYVNISGENFKVSNILTLNNSVNNTKGKIIAWMVFFNDSSNNNNQTSIFTFDIKNSPPLFNGTYSEMTAYSNEAFNFDVNCSDIDTADTLTYFVNGSVVSINPSTGIISDTPAEIENGTYLLNITCGDGFENSSLLLNYSINDNDPPTVTLVAPANNTNISNAFISYNFSINDGGLLKNASFWANDVGGEFAQRQNNGTNLLINGTTNTINYSTPSQVNFVWNVQVCDWIGNCAFAQANYTLSVDTTSPTVGTVYPQANSAIFNTIYLNTSANDSLTGVKSVRYSVANTTFSTALAEMSLVQDTIMQGFWNVSLDTTTFNDGEYNLTLNASDYAGNFAVSLSTIFIDNNPPQWSNPTKNDSPVIQNDTIMFNTTWFDAVNLSGFVFSINQFGDWTNQTFQPITGRNYVASGNATITAAEAVVVYWMFFASDSRGFWNQTDVQNFTIGDTMSPEVTLNYPPHTGFSIQTILIFNFTLNDSSPLSNASVYGNFSGAFELKQSNGTAPLLNGTYNYINISGLLEGEYIWNVLACDYPVSTPPNCDFAPANYTFILDRTYPAWSDNNTNQTVDTPKQGDDIQLNVTLTDNLGLVQYIYSTNDSGVWQNFSYSVSSTTVLVSITELVTSITDKIVGWTVFFSDGAGNRNQTDLFTYVVRPGGGDRSRPEITLVSPANNSKLNLSDISFNFTLSDLSGLSNATLYANFSGNFDANQTILVIGNAYNGSINVTNLPEARYIWNTLACDNVTPDPNCGFRSANFTLLVDRTPPSFTNNITSPSNSPIYTEGLQYFFNITWNDLDIETVLIESNFSGILINQSATTISENVYSFTPGELAGGIYHLKWYANDTAGHSNQTEIYLYEVQKNQSNISLYLNSARGDTSITVYQLLNSTAILEGQINKTITLSSNFSFWESQSGPSPYTNISNATVYGKYFVNASFAGNRNYTATFENWTVTVSDLIAPSWSNPSKNESAVTQFSFVSFNATWNDNFNLSHYLFSDNQSGDWVNSSAFLFTGELNYSFNISQIIAYQGKLVGWMFFANDSSGNWNQTDIQLYTVLDTHAPNVSLVTPLNASNYSGTNLVLQFVPIDNVELLNATLYINASGIFEQNVSNFTLTNGTLNTLTVKNIAEGFYEWNVLVYDTAGNSNFSTINFTVTVDNTPPVVDFITANDTYFPDTTGFLNFTPTDIRLANCSLYSTVNGNWALNYTDFEPESGQNNNFSFRNLQNGTYLWNVLCFDSAGNSAFNQTNFTFTIDTDFPNVTSLSPSNNTLKTSSSSVDFDFNVSDTNPIGNCSLVINEQIADTLTSITRNESNRITNSLANGVFNWSINCTDLAGNIGQSILWNISINVPTPNRKAFIGYYTNLSPEIIKYRRYEDFVWGSEYNDTINQSVNSTNWVVVRTSPTRDEAVLVTLDQTGSIKGQVWDGISWENNLTFTTSVSSTHTGRRGYDIAYEQNTSRAMVVYTDNTATPKFNIWNGSGWHYPSGQPLLADSCAAAPVWIRLASRLNSSEITEVDLDTTGDICAQIWDGTSWGNSKLIDGNPIFKGNESFDVAYEQLSGDLMIAWQNNNPGQPAYIRHFASNDQ